MNESFYRIEKNKLLLSIKVIPNSDKNRICGIRNDHLLVRLTAPARDNKANKAAVLFISSSLDVAKRECLIIRGKKAREKQLELPLRTKAVLDKIIGD